MVSRSPIVDVQNLQVVGEQVKQEGPDRTKGRGLKAEESRELTMPDPAKLFRRTLNELAGQNALLVYQRSRSGDPASFGIVNASFDADQAIRPGRPIPYNQQPINERLLASAAGRLGLDISELQHDTNSRTLFPVEGPEGQLMILPHRGENPQILDIDQLRLPDRSQFVQLAQVPMPANPGEDPQQDPKPAPQQGPQPLANFGAALQPLKGKDAVLVFRSQVDEKFYYGRAQVAAEQDSVFPRVKADVQADLGSWPGGRPGVPGARAPQQPISEERLTKIAEELKLPDGAEILPFSEAPAELQKALGQNPLVAGDKLYVKQLPSWARYGVAPVAAVEAEPGRQPAQPQQAKPWTAEAMGQGELQQALYNSSSVEGRPVFIALERDGVKEVVAGTLRRPSRNTSEFATGYHFEISLAQGEKGNSFRLAGEEKQKIADALDVTPGQIQDYRGGAAEFGRGRTSKKIFINASNGRLHIGGEETVVFAVKPR